MSMQCLYNGLMYTNMVLGEGCALLVVRIICGINLWWFVVGGDVGCGGAELTPH